MSGSRVSDKPKNLKYKKLKTVLESEICIIGHLGQCIEITPKKARKLSKWLLKAANYRESGK